MAASILNSLVNMVDNRTIGDVAQSLGQPAQSVSRAIEPSFAALLSGLANNADNPNILRRILDSVPSAARTGSSLSQIATAASDPSSTWMTAGKHLLSALFGTGESTVTNAISRASSLSPGATGTLLSMAAPLVIGFVSKRMTDSGMNINGLASLLQRESSTFRSALPAGLSDTVWPVKTSVAAGSPVIAQAVQKETSSNWLLPLLGAAALALGCLWLFSHARRPAVPQVASAPTGEANRYATPAPSVACSLPAGVTLPDGGTASRLLAIAQDPNAKLSTDTWFNSDQVTFDSGSAKLKPGAQAELNNIASVLTSCPNVRMTVAGYTDSVGSPEANLRLGRSRADVVVAELVNRGIGQERLVAEGYGEKDPVADNSTDDGRAQNRRVAINVTQK